MRLNLLLLLLLPALLSAAAPRVDTDRPDGNAFFHQLPVEQRSDCSVPRRSSVNEAMNELFTCLLEKHVEPTEEFQQARRIDFRGIAGSGVSQGPLLTGVYSVSRLSAASESYRRFYDVATIFTAQLGVQEVRGSSELAKLDAYLGFLQASPIVRDTHATLLANGALPAGSTLAQFVRGYLYDHWFKQYARTVKAHERGLRESSGFGHVFVGEVKTTTVTGFHNWLQLLSAEEAGDFNYKGHVRIVGSPVLIGGIQFSWLDRSKSLSSVMFGVPPEYEIALYSACFIANPGRKTNLSVKGKPLSVQTHYVYHQRESVATAYPVV